MLASGTRGDVQPCCALGAGLQNAGIPVVVAAASRYQAMVESSGVGFAPLEGNPSDVMRERSGAMAVSLRGGVLQGIAATARFLRAAQAEYARMLTSAAAACAGARAIVVGLASTWGVSIAEALGVPAVFCMLQPWSRTRAFPSPLLPLRGSLGGLYNAASYRVIEQAMWQPWRRVTNAWRRETLGLPPLPAAGPWKSLYARGFTCLHGFSPSVLPPPADWPASHRVTGYWFLDSGVDRAPGAQLQEFLSSGKDRPLYIGFGSMGMDPGALAVIREALEAADMRAIVSADPTERTRQICEGSSRILVAEDIRHDWLFPRVSAVVHHGGAGTTAEGLRAGVPSIIVPGASDQYFWGQRIARLGAGPRPLGRRQFNAGNLSALFRQAAGDGRFRGRAQQLAELIRSEDGVAAAVAALLPLLS